MEALFKRYFWVINLLALSVVAWLIAQTIVDFLSTKYLTIQPSTTEVASVVEIGTLVEKADGELEKTLVARSPFNVDEKEDGGDGAEPECEPKCDEKTCGADGCDGMCGVCPESEKCNAEGKCEPKIPAPKECEMDISLVGTMTSPTDPEERFANLMVGGQSDFYERGAEVGTATIVDIIPKMVYLREGDSLCHVSLWSEPKPKKGSTKPRIRNTGKPLSRPKPGDSARNRPGTPKRGVAFDYSTGVVKLGEFNYKIDRQMLDEQLTDLTQLGMQARVIPNYRKGKYEGFKLVGVRPGSLYRAIGIRSGDIVRSINGKAINSPNKAMELFTQLQTSNSIELQIERRGKLETFNYTIQ